jgi:hypothetical protein
VTRSEPPAPLVPALRDRSAWGDFAAPRLRDVGAEARWLGDPPIAVVSVTASKAGPAAGLLVTPHGEHAEYGALVLEWLSRVEASGPVRVPAALRPHFGSLKALAVPMKTATWTVGVLALPLRPGWGPIARELEALGGDFANRFEAAHRRAELVYLRMASVGRRPVGRREETAHSPARSYNPAAIQAPAPGSPAPNAATPRARGARPPSGTRRLELPAGAIGRDGTLALGRR